MRKGWTLNFFGALLTLRPEMVTERIINHERIHTAQQRELLWIFFYLIYGLEWAVRFLLYRSAAKAYTHVSFEAEAYGHDSDPDYLHHRPLYAQWRRHKHRSPRR